MLLSGEGEGWSMVHRNTTESEALRMVETATFRARAMPARKAAGYRPEALLPAQLRKPPVGAIVREPSEPAPSLAEQIGAAAAASLGTPAPAPAPARPQGVKVDIFKR